MGLFDRIKAVVSSKEWPGAAEWIPTARVAPSATPAPAPFAADSTYLRVWLAEAHLSHSRKWFTDWHPLVHAAVARRYGDTNQEQVAVVSPGAIPGFDGAAAAAVTVDKPITPLLPFPGGTVSLNVGLVAIKGDNTVRTLIDVVGGFGGLLTMSSLSMGAAIAGQVVDAFERLFGLGGNIGTLAYDSTLALAGGGAPVALAPGYLAVLDATQPADSLWVRDGRLISWRGQRPVNELARELSAAEAGESCRPRRLALPSRDRGTAARGETRCRCRHAPGPLPKGDHRRPDLA